MTASRVVDGPLVRRLAIGRQPANDRFREDSCFKDRVSCTNGRSSPSVLSVAPAGLKEDPKQIWPWLVSRLSELLEEPRLAGRPRLCPVVKVRPSHQAADRAVVGARISRRVDRDFSDEVDRPHHGTQTALRVDRPDRVALMPANRSDAGLLATEDTQAHLPLDPLDAEVFQASHHASTAANSAIHT